MKSPYCLAVSLLAQPAATLIVIPAANHVYRAAAAMDPVSQMKLYTDPTIPVVPELASSIVTWIRGLK